MKKVVMLYDGLCVLCIQTQRAVQLLDWFRRIERIDAQNQEVVLARFPELQDEDLLGEIFVQTRNGDWQVGFWGMRYLATQMPLTWLFLPVFYAPGTNKIGPIIYRWVAHRRYAINKALGYDCAGGACKIAHNADPPPISESHTS